MAELVEHTKGKTRDLPIDGALKKILLTAAEWSGIHLVRVTSGGQCAKGTCKKRTGSTRHDLGLAADLEIWINGRALDFTKEDELPYFQAFVRSCAKLGATGIGAGLGYMGPRTIHVGFGRKAVWGKGRAREGAPDWLVEAAKEGWMASLDVKTRTEFIA